MPPIEKTTTITAKDAVTAYSSSPTWPLIICVLAMIPYIEKTNMKVPNASAITCI